MRRGGRSRIPCDRTAPPNILVRAAHTPAMLAMFPPLTRTPLLPAGIPTSSAIQRTVCASISVAIGESE